MFNAVKTLAENHALRALEEAVILRTVLESKGIIADEEIEAKRKRREERFRTALELEAMLDPELKKGLEQIEEILGRLRAADEAPGTPPAA
jgi:hypothetical protein